MMGSVDGEPKKIIANISVGMSFQFSSHMQTLLSEAKSGAFSTKGDAVRRRDELILTPAATAVAETDPAATAVAGEETQEAVDAD